MIPENTAGPAAREKNVPEITDTDRALILLIQDGIALTPHPFKEAAERLGITEEDVVLRIRDLRERNIIRRFGASIGHRKIGFVYNAMIVWDIPDERAAEAGKIMAEIPEVSHCYERPRHPEPPYEWPYNLFTMVHGRSEAECAAIAEKISKAVGVSSYKLVFSEAEFKKVGVRI